MQIEKILRARKTWLLYFPLISYLGIALSTDSTSLVLMVEPFVFYWFPVGIFQFLGFSVEGEAKIIAVIFSGIWFIAYFIFIYLIKDLGNRTFKAYASILLISFIMASIGCADGFRHASM